MKELLLLLLLLLHGDETDGGMCVHSGSVRTNCSNTTFQTKAAIIEEPGGIH